MSTTTPTSPPRLTQPVRAITSTLSARAAPPVPPASQTYEPLARAVLRRRLLYDILPPSALPIWASTVLWKTWCSGGVSSLSISDTLAMPFLPSTLLMTTLVWAFGVLPIIVLRKSHLTAVSTPSSSPSQCFKVAFSKPSTVRALSVYILAGIFISTSHIIFGRIFEGSPRSSDYFGVFVKSRKHPYYLNGRFVFLFMAQVMISVSFHFRNILLDRVAVRRTQGETSQMDAISSLFRRVLSVSGTTFAFTTAILPAYILMFGLVRAVGLPILFQVSLVSRLFRPFLGHFLRGRWSLVYLWRNRELVWHTFLLALTTVEGWEFAESLFDDKVQEPLVVATHAVDPFLTLISGITSSDAYYAHFSYIELRTLAEDDSAAASTRRTTMFGDQKHSPPLWASLVRTALLTLGKDYQVLLRRGAPPPPPAAPKPKPKSGDPVAPATPFIRKPVFKNAPGSPRHSVNAPGSPLHSVNAPGSPLHSVNAPGSPLLSVVESFAADGAVTQALEHSLDSTVAQLPDLFKSTGPPAPVAAVQRTVATVKAAGPTLLEKIPTLSGLIPQRIQAPTKEVAQWWSRPRASRLADGVVPNRETDILIAEVLSRLVCASLTEDRYGAVQRDIPRILEALLVFLTALEDAQREIVVSDDGDEAARAIDVYGRPADAMKEAVVRIVQTFGPRLTAFRFPPRIAQKLQGFADYY